jgi:hypothetical protein
MGHFKSLSRIILPNAYCFRHRYTQSDGTKFHILPAKPVTKMHASLVITFFNSFNPSPYGGGRNFLVALHAVVETCAY